MHCTLDRDRGFRPAKGKASGGRPLARCLSAAGAWLILAAMMSGCRPPEGPAGPAPVALPAPPHPARTAADAPSARDAARAPGDKTAAERDIADLQGVLFLNILGNSEWKQGDTVTFDVVVENKDTAALSDLELRCEIQFGLTDTIGEGRTQIPLGALSPGAIRSYEHEYWVTKAGIWHVKAAIFRHETLIVATTRTLYIREVEQPSESSPAEAPVEKGPPLVENAAALTRLDPEQPIWVDAERRAVIMIGRVCQRQCSLELFACVRNSKEHESVLSIAVRPSSLHAGLLAVGAEPGRPVQFYPEFIPAQGPEVDIRLIWKDEAGNLHQSPAQDWVRNTQTGQALQDPWIFTGSQMLKEEEGSDKEYYYADATGELICVSNFPSAVLDLPIRSSDSNEALLFEAFTEQIPPLGTEVTLVLTPKPAATKPAGESVEQGPAAPPTEPPPSSTPPSTSAPRPPSGPSPSSESPPPSGPSQ